MAILYRNLSEDDRELIKSRYALSKSEDVFLSDIQKDLAEHFDVTPRTIRNWARSMELGVLNKNRVNPAKVLTYDIETSRGEYKLWWTGKQYVGYKQMTKMPKIITIAWKWLGEDKVYSDTWDKNHCDKSLMETFLPFYNEADMVIGYNNDNFDNRWCNARAMEHKLDINTYVKSFDIIKQSKKLFRLPSYSLDFLAKTLGVTKKQGHDGILMWEMVEDGTKEQQKEYLKKMLEYNVGDIITTEECYLALRKYMGHKMHLGVLAGEKNYTCPNCGGSDLDLTKTTTTPAGTIQRIMTCKDEECKSTFKISNRNYYKLKEIEQQSLKLKELEDK